MLKKVTIFFCWLILVIIPSTFACSPSTVESTVTSESTTIVTSTVTTTSYETFMFSTNFPHEGSINIDGDVYLFTRIDNDILARGESIKAQGGVIFTPDPENWIHTYYCFNIEFPDGNTEYLRYSSIFPLPPSTAIHVNFTSHQNPQAGIMILSQRLDDQSGLWTTVMYMLVG
jgi:hypothetical protein